MRKRALIAWSGGKDSAWTLQVLRRQPDIEVAGLFTTVHDGAARIAVHEVRTSLLQAQARAAGASSHTLAIPRPCPNAVYEEVLRGFVEKQKNQGISHLAFGDLFLEDLRAYRERNLAKAGMRGIFPLWNIQ